MENKGVGRHKKRSNNKKSKNNSEGSRIAHGEATPAEINAVSIFPFFSVDIWKHHILAFLHLKDLVHFTMTCKYTYNSKLLSYYPLPSRAVVSDGFLKWSKRTGCVLNYVSITIDISSIHEFDIYRACFLRDGRLAVGSLDGTISVWDTNNSTVTHQILSPCGEVNALCELDGNRLASGSSDGLVIIWRLGHGHDLNMGVELFFEAHDDVICSMYCDRNRNLVTVSEDGLIKIWDTFTGVCMHSTTALDMYNGSQIGYITSSTTLESGLLMVASVAGRGQPYIINCYDISDERRASRNATLIPNVNCSMSRTHTDNSQRINESGYKTFVYLFCLCSLLNCDGFAIGYGSPDNDGTTKIGIYEVTKVGDMNISIESKLVMKGHGEVVRDITTAVNGNLVSCSYDGTIMLHRRTANYSFEPAQKIQLHSKEINFVIAFPSGLGVITGGRDDRLCYTALEERAYYRTDRR